MQGTTATRKTIHPFLSPLLLCLVSTTASSQLRVAKSVTPTAIAVGETATFTLTIDNTANPMDLTNCVITDPIASCMVLDTGSCIPVPVITVDCGVGMPDTVSTAPFTIAASTTQTVSFSVTGLNIGMCANSFDVRCTEDSGTASSLLDIQAPPADIVVTKTVAPSPILVGETATFTIVIENTGGTPLTDCRLADPVPACAALDTASCTSTPAITVDCGVIAPDEVNTSSSPFTIPIAGTQEVTFDVTGTVPGDCLNSVDVRCAEGSTTGSTTLVIDPIPPTTTFDKSVSPDTVIVGETATFTLTIDNTLSATDVTDCRLDDLLPTCLTLDTSSCTPMPAIAVDCGIMTPGAILVPALFSVPAGATQVITFEATGDVIGDCVNAFGVECTEVSGSNDTTLTVEAPPSDTTVSKTVDPPSAGVGASATFTIVIDNTMNVNPLTNCVLTDPIPPCMLLDGASCTTNPTIPVDCGASIPNAVQTTASPFSVAAGDTQTFTFDVTGDVEGDCLNDVDVRCDVFDGGDSETLTVTSGSLATVSKEVSPASIGVGSMATFTITVDNTLGTAALTNCVVLDPIDPGCMTLDTASCDSTPTLTIDCGIGVPNTVQNAGSPFTVAAGATQTVTFVVTGDAEATCSNTADVQCDVFGGTGSTTLDVGAVGCDLLGVDISFPPVSPTRSGAWVYTTMCTSGDDRLDNTQVVLASPAIGGPSDTPDDIVGSGGTLRLYQIDCDCPTDLYVSKNDITGKVAITLF